MNDIELLSRLVIGIEARRRIGLSGEEVIRDMVRKNDASHSEAEFSMAGISVEAAGPDEMLTAWLEAAKSTIRES
jgi:hypothetical protein